MASIKNMRLRTLFVIIATAGILLGAYLHTIGCGRGHPCHFVGWQLVPNDSKKQQYGL